MCRLLTIVLMLLLASCADSDRKHHLNAAAMLKELRADPGPVFGSYAEKARSQESVSFVGVWVRGRPSSNGTYGERLVVTGERYKYFEDGEVVMAGPTEIVDNLLLICPAVNRSRYFQRGCWGVLRSNGNALDLFGIPKGMLCFDRISITEQQHEPDDDRRPSTHNEPHTRE